MKNKRRGIVFVISGASGSGKTTLCHFMTKQFKNVVYSISTTTRARRGKEKEGKDYFFILKREFKKKILNFIEWAQVYGEYYGTSKKFIEETTKFSKDVVMDIDTVGAAKIKKVLGNNAVLIFIMPPSLSVLKQRLIKRRSDSKETIEKRFNLALTEMKEMVRYDYIVVNNKLKDAAYELSSIIVAERNRKERNFNYFTSKFKL